MHWPVHPFFCGEWGSRCGCGQLLEDGCCWVTLRVVPVYHIYIFGYDDTIVMWTNEPCAFVISFF